MTTNYIPETHSESRQTDLRGSFLGNIGDHIFTVQLGLN